MGREHCFSKQNFLQKIGFPFSFTHGETVSGAYSDQNYLGYFCNAFPTRGRMGLGYTKSLHFEHC